MYVSGSAQAQYWSLYCFCKGLYIYFLSIFFLRLLWMQQRAAGQTPTQGLCTWNFCSTNELATSCPKTVQNLPFVLLVILLSKST